MRPRAILGGQEMHKLRSENSTPRVDGVRALCAFLAWSLMLIAAPSAIGGDVPRTATGMTSMSVVSRLVIRLRPGVHPATGEVLADPLRTKLQAAMGRGVSVGSPT